MVGHVSKCPIERRLDISDKLKSVALRKEKDAEISKYAVNNIETQKSNMRSSIVNVTMIKDVINN